MGQDKVDEELAKNIQGEEAAETTLSAKNTLPTHDCFKYENPNLLAEAPIIIAEAKIIKNLVEVGIDKKDRVEEDT